MTDIMLSKATTALGQPAAPVGLGVALAEAPLMAMITVKGDLGAPAMAAAVERAVGAPVPAVRRVETAGDRRALWMAPDELMLQGPYAERMAMLAAAEGALTGQAAMVLDVSDARQIFTLTGDGAREVLAKGAPVDLSRQSFGLGDLRRTRIAQVAAAFYQTGEGPDVFEVYCFRSYAPYLWRWLGASAKSAAMPGVL